MQTRRDQLQAYRFQNRRALAALVTGRPNVLEAPMRRLTVTTVSGIMIAILIAVGFALLGTFKPTSGSAWRDPGAIIVENETGASYVFLDKVLHPVLNYPSAVLAVGTGATPHVVHVDRSDLAGVKRGATIGIDGLPESLPASSDLVDGPWTVCSRLHANSGGRLDAQVDLLAGADGHARPVPGGSGALVAPPSGSTRYLLFDGQRFAVSSSTVATALGLENAPSLTVGTAFIDAMPAGPQLKAPHISDLGDHVPYRVDGHAVVAGQLVHATDGKDFLVLRDGLVLLDEVQADLLRTVDFGTGRQPPTVTTTESEALRHIATDSRQWSAISAQLAGLPSAVPPLTHAPSDNAGICAVYQHGAVRPRLAVPPGSAPTYPATRVSQSAASRLGHADWVVLAPGAGALVTSADGAKTVFLLADPGRLYPFASRDELAGFGYGNVTPSAVPEPLIAMLATGPPLDQQAARRPVTG